MRPDERYALRKDKNQSVLPQQCGMPGPRVKVLPKGGGAPDWQQSIEEVFTSKDDYKLTGAGPGADYKSPVYTVDGKDYMPARQVRGSPACPCRHHCHR